MKKVMQTLGQCALVLGAFFICVIILMSASKILLTLDDDNDKEIAGTSFPVSVDPVAKIIIDNPAFDNYIENYMPQLAQNETGRSTLDSLIALLSRSNFYQQLANPVTRIIVIYPGERKEEVAKNIGDILRWDQSERQIFIDLVSEALPVMAEGKFYPGRYTVERNAGPKDVAELLLKKFDTEVLSHYDASVAKQVPLSDALTIASLLEREAYNFTDMRIISGIIWNRLFIDMPLQLDATLQYVKANAGGNKWWPKVLPADKFIPSPFNTYEEKGLPPAPIANPSVASIIAALNPEPTNCLFYFHDTDGTFYCTETYQGHVELLKELYGQGK